MKKLMKALSIGIMTAVVSSYATGVDPADYVLIAYTLTAAQKAQFKTNDNKASDFWAADWSGRDYIDLNTTANSYPGRDAWTGADDAHITIKAAADAEGLYLDMIVDDNVFVDPVGTDWMKDACDIYFDALPSEQVKAATPDILVNPAYGWALTTSSQQFQVFMGAASVPRSLCYNFYDPTFFDWTANNVLFDDLPTLYKGMDLEVFRISDTQKGQEWFIPWNYIGVAGIPAGTALAGKRFAFTGGYNDQDDPAAGDSKCLRWRQYDPFAPTGGMESWGDIEMAEDMPAVTGVGVQKGMINHSVVKNGKVVRTELYNLKGVKIPAGTPILRNSLVVEKSILADGSSYSRQIRYTK